jgi:hypothetical protein
MGAFIILVGEEGLASLDQSHEVPGFADLQTRSSPFYRPYNKTIRAGWPCYMVGEEGLEPSRFIQPADFKSTAYTNSATRPFGVPTNVSFEGCHGGTYESRTRLKGFADLRVTAPPTRHDLSSIANQGEENNR